MVTHAYLESYYLAMATGDEKYLYPGFAQTVNANSDDGLFDGTQKLWSGTKKPTTWVGTFRQHILRPDESCDDVSVVGCVYTFESAPDRRQIQSHHRPGPEQWSNRVSA